MTVTNWPGVIFQVVLFTAGLLLLLVQAFAERKDQR